MGCKLIVCVCVREKKMAAITFFTYRFLRSTMAPLLLKYIFAIFSEFTEKYTTYINYLMYNR